MPTSTVITPSIRRSDGPKGYTITTAQFESRSRKRGARGATLERDARGLARIREGALSSDCPYDYLVVHSHARAQAPRTRRGADVATRPERLYGIVAPSIGNILKRNYAPSSSVSAHSWRANARLRGLLMKRAASRKPARIYTETALRRFRAASNHFTSVVPQSLSARAADA